MCCWCVLLFRLDYFLVFIVCAVINSTSSTYKLNKLEISPSIESHVFFTILFFVSANTHKKTRNSAQKLCAYFRSQEIQRIGERCQPNTKYSNALLITHTNIHCQRSYNYDVISSTDITNNYPIIELSSYFDSRPPIKSLLHFVLCVCVCSSHKLLFIPGLNTSSKYRKKKWNNNKKRRLALG